MRGETIMETTMYTTIVVREEIASKMAELMRKLNMNHNELLNVMCEQFLESCDSEKEADEFLAFALENPEFISENSRMQEEIESVRLLFPATAKKYGL